MTVTTRRSVKQAAKAASEALHTPVLPYDKRASLRVAIPEGGFVLVSGGDFEGLLDQCRAAEDAADEAESAFALAEHSANPQNALPVELVERMVEGESPVRIWRGHRGLKGKELARHVGISASYLSDIEHGRKPGSTATIKAIANALQVTVDDLL